MILIINFNNKSEILEYIKNNNLNSNMNFCILNNGGDSSQWITHRDISAKNVTIFCSTKNLGYLNGADFIMENINNIQKYDFIVLNNTDVTYSVNVLVSELYKIKSVNNPETILYGPNLVNSQGNSQNPFSIVKPPKKQFFKWKLFFSNRLLFLIYTKLSQVRKKEATFCENPYAIHGAFMIFSKEFFKKGGNFSYPSFLFAEELYIGWMVNEKLSKKVGVLDNFKVIHNEHTTTKKLTSDFRRKNMNKSLKRVYREMYR